MNPALGAGKSASETKGRGFRIDWLLVLSAALLTLVGLMSLFSEGQGKPGGGVFGKQVMLLVIGLIPFAICFFVPPASLRKQATAIYVVNLLLLAAVLVAGKQQMGAQRWFQLGPITFQPSEVAKLLVVITLSSFFAARQEQVERFSTFALSFAHVAVPAALIFKQPHLGATLVVLAIWVAICIAAGVPLKYVGSFVAGAILLFVAVWSIPGVLKSYQKDRIEGLLHANAKDNGYQSLRSQIAFGSGGLLGEGYLQGEQKKARFIPEQRNDFIFTVIGEEGGLVGCSLVLIAFGFFFFRAWLVMLEASEPFLKMLVAGILGMLGFHTIVNLGMVLQIMPVVGLWLPFMSYGGTALWLCMACVGLLLAIRRSERPVLFS